VEGVGSALGPVATDDLRDRKEGTPVVPEAVVGGGRQHGVAGGNGGEVVLGPAGEFATEGGFNFNATVIEAGLERAGRCLGERNDNRAVAERRGEVPDAGQGGGGIGFEGTDAAAFAPENAGAVFVAGVNETAQLGVEVEVGVQFVQEERGLVQMGDAEQDGGFQVMGTKDFGAHGSQNVKGGRFAAARFGGSEVKARGEGKSGEGMSVSGPEGQDHGGAGRQPEVNGVAIVDLVKEGRGVEDRLGPGLELFQTDVVGLGVIFQGTGAVHGIIEAGEAEVEAFGFGAADAVVLRERKTGKTLESGGVGFGQAL